MVDATTFNGWAIVELFGHRQLAGLASEVQLAGKGFVCIQIPACPERSDESYAYDATPEVTQLYSPEAVFSLTPTTEESARAFMASKQLGRYVRRSLEPVEDAQVGADPEPLF